MRYAYWHVLAHCGICEDVYGANNPSYSTKSFHGVINDCHS